MSRAANIRLGPAQKELYDRLPATPPVSYPPAKKLVELGLAYWQGGILKKENHVPDRLPTDD